MPQVLQSQNLAPIRPLYDLADKSQTTPTYITAGLQELLEDVYKRDESTFREIIDTTEITSNFIQGKQIFQQTTQGWRIQNVRKADPNKIRSINTMQYYATQNIDSFTSSNPDLEPAEHFKQIAYKDKIKKSAAVWNGYEKKFYTAWFNQQEALHCFISGTYIESVQYDNLAEGAMAFKEIWGETEVPISEGKGKCFACDKEEKAEAFTETDDLPKCPNCGSMDIHVTPSISQIIPSVTGLQPIKMGDISLKLIPIQAGRFDVRKRAEESSYFIESISMAKSKLEMVLGTKLNIGEGEKDRGQESLDSIAKAGNTLFGEQSGVSTNKTSKDVTIYRSSLSPEEYAHIRSSVDEKTVSGETIPGQSKLIDMCPNGATILTVNGFKNILGIYPGVHHSLELTSGIYHMRLASGVGRGSEDTVEVQKRFNRNDAQMLKAGETGATPAHFHVEGSVDRRHVKHIGFPGVSVPIKREIVEALGTTELIRQIPPASIAGTFFQYTYEVLDKYRQMVSHAPDLSNSLLGSRSGGTATEARISDANSEKLAAPMLQIKADVRCGTADKTLALYNKHFKGVSKFFAYGTTKQGTAVGDQIKGEDIDCDIEFVVVKDSQRPKNRYTQQSGMAAAGQIINQFGGIKDLQENEPALLHEILQSFDVELDLDHYDTMEDLCWSRLQQAVQMAGQPPEVIVQSIKPIITPFEPNHPDKLIWFQDYLDCPDGIALSEPERQTIFLLITAHRNEGVQEAGEKMKAINEAQVIGTQPLVEQQAAAAQAAQPPPEQPEPPVPPIQKIAESIHYPDAPEDLKRQIEVAAGFEPSTEPPPPPADAVKATIESAKLHAQAEQNAAQHEHETDHKLLDIAEKEKERKHELSAKVVDAHIGHTEREHQATVAVKQAKQMPKPPKQGAK